KHIEGLVQVQRAFSEKRTVRFRNYAVFEAPPRFGRGLRRALRKNGFSVEIWVNADNPETAVKPVRRLERAGIATKICVDEKKDQRGVYVHFSALGLPVTFSDPHYTAESPDEFDRWLCAPRAIGINTYCDIINMLVMQTYSPNCRHASCFGSTFYVDGELRAYLCPYCRDERTLLGSLREAAGVEELLCSPAVAELLPGAIQRRESCTSKGCKSFPYCQGGCPLEQVGEGECAHYGATVERIALRLREVYREGKLSQVNNVVKNAILNALAFGTAFFDERD
ncbi:MAG: hypothetical protein IJD22_00280, partial [Clostridia bacterium]|nr:hypothetical protein [Clostridia bacterium]